MKYKFWIRPLAIIMLINFITSFIYPTISYALTSGPIAPEYTDFEPADATELVNMATGDFTYTLPVINIPGPEGGYPLALAYHAGVEPSQEATWVGLGWSLNAGAINRMVNNIPDDVNGVSRDTRNYWKGGETIEHLRGVGILGQRFVRDEAWDTYKGHGVGFEVDISIPIEAAYIGFSFGSGPYGESFAGFGVGVGWKGLVSAGIDFSSRDGVSLSAGTLIGGVGVNFNSGQFSAAPSVSINSSSSTVNNSYGSISSYSTINDNSVNLLLFSYENVDIYTRYWSDVSDYVSNYGTLQYQNADYTVRGNTPGAHQALDAYALPDLRSDAEAVKNPNMGLGGSLPSFDTYMVTAQGLFGYMRPYIFDNVDLFCQDQNNPNDTESDLIYVNSGFPSTPVTGAPLNKGSKANFRFVGDFSNSFTQNNNLYFDATTNSVKSIPANSQTRTGFDADRSYLEGSKHTEWFSNADIMNGNAANYGFLKYPNFDYSYFSDDLNFHRIYNSSTNFTDQVGGYMVTNASGVTYHFSLPVYAYGEYTRTQSDDNTTVRWESKKEPYAYVWLLTAITGPDFVDRGGGTDGTASNGVLDAADWGYWVQFNYGKWTDKYNWRSPAEGTIKDIDQSTNYFSYGYKQLYYLDAVRTRSHTAVFVKDIREDGKGVSDFENGSFLPKKIDKNSCDNNKDIFHDPPLGEDPDVSIAKVDYTAYPVSTMKLEEIYLLTNQDYDEFINNNYTTVDNFKASSNVVYPQGIRNVCQCPTGDPGYYFTQYKDYTDIHQDKNVLDVNDLNMASLKQRSIKVIDFNYSYDLCPGTPNSFSNSVYTADPLPVETTLGGKLTLASVDILGRSGVRITPSVKFDYGQKNSDGTVNIGNNPTYSKDKYDIWGNYKSDLDGTLLTQNETAARYVTQNNAGQVDKDNAAWSLRKITLPLNNTLSIQYETDRYDNVALGKGVLNRIKDFGDYRNFGAEDPYVSPVGALGIGIHAADVDFEFYDSNQDLGQLYKVGDKVHLILMLYYHNWASYDIYTCKYLDVYVPIVDIKSTTKLTLAYNGEFSTKLNALRSGIYPIVDEFDEIVIGGFIIRDLPQTYGGGTRTKEIRNTTSTKSVKTIYEYNNGYTSFEPFGMPQPYLNSPKSSPDGITYTQTFSDEMKIRMRNFFNEVVLDFYRPIISLSQTIPAPGVRYGQISVTKQIADIDADGNETNTKNMPGKSVYDYSTYEQSNDKTSDAVVYNWSDLLTNTTTNNVTVQDFSSRIGVLKKITNYADYEGTVPLSEKQYTYLHDLSYDAVTKKYSNSGIIDNLHNLFDYQGIVEQIFHDYKTVDANKKFVTTKKSEYPNVLISQTTIDHKKGIQENIKYLEYDYISGKPISSLIRASDGSYFLTEVTPAYHKYPSLGLKTDNIKNKYILSDAYSTEMFVSDATGTNKLGLTSASIQTWSNNVSVFEAMGSTQVDMWRRQAAYSWVGSDAVALNNDGTYPVASYSTDLANTGWLKTGEVTLYDPFSHVLESKDASGNYSAVLFDASQTKVMMSASNARFSDIAYAGLENSLIYNKEGGVFTGPASNALNTFVDETHTGTNSMVVIAGNYGLSYTIPKACFTAASGFKTGLKYRASVWVYMPGFSESESQAVELSARHLNDAGGVISSIPIISAYPSGERKSKSWYLLQLDNITPNTLYNLHIYTKNNSSRGVYMDDFRLQPMNASAVSYVYDRYTNDVTYTLDNNNLYTKYEYDNAGKVVRSLKEIFYTTDKILFQNKENYARKD